MEDTRGKEFWDSLSPEAKRAFMDRVETWAGDALDDWRGEIRELVARPLTQEEIDTAKESLAEESSEPLEA